MPVMEDFGVHVSTHLTSLQSLRGGVPEGLPAQLAEIAPILKSFDTRLIEISKDDSLSAIGKDNALKAARESAAADIEKWRLSKVNGIEAQIATSRAALQAKADKDLSKPTDLQITNMVQRLREFDPLEVEILYADASDEERRIIEVAAEAIGRQPIRQGTQIIWAPLIPPDRIDAVKEARIERTNPDGVAALKDLQRLSTDVLHSGWQCEGIADRS